MKKTFLLLMVTINLNLGFAQDLPTDYYPTDVQEIDLSAETEAEIQRQSQLLKKEEKEELTSSEESELNLLLRKHGEVVTSMWDIIEGGCSWYCGGGNYLVKSSSNLKPGKSITYNAENANDLSYKTAWVEGSPDEGIDEYLEYHFKNESPRITKIIITNGYVKSETAWRNNNRVKKLRLIANDSLLGVLNLEDSRTDQAFEVGTLGHNLDGTDLILRFEIAGVYRGDKYNDTVITEIYFDGIDVH